MIQEFLNEARAYCAARGIKLVTLGRYAVDDKELFPRLMRGGQCLPRTMERVRQYMNENPHPPAHGDAAPADQGDAA